MRNLLLMIVVFLFTGCLGSPFIPMTKDEVIENKYILFNPPNNKWYKYYKPTRWKKSRSIPEQSQWFTMGNNSYQGTNYDIEIETNPFSLTPIDILFDKDGDYEASTKADRDSEYIKNRNKEQGITYDHDETQYLKNMKCLGSVFSRSGGIYSKNYSITCGYYDKSVKENNGKRILRIGYTYNYASGYYNRLQKDKGVPDSELLTTKQAEDALKQAVKELVKTIKIKNFDRGRMEKEGLMHYDKEFKSTKW